MLARPRDMAAANSEPPGVRLSGRRLSGRRLTSRSMRRCTTRRKSSPREARQGRSKGRGGATLGGRRAPPRSRGNPAEPLAQVARARVSSAIVHGTAHAMRLRPTAMTHAFLRGSPRPSDAPMRLRCVAFARRASRRRPHPALPVPRLLLVKTLTHNPARA